MVVAASCGGDVTLQEAPKGVVKVEGKINMENCPDLNPMENLCLDLKTAAHS